jgi:hypothetical protein
LTIAVTASGIDENTGEPIPTADIDDDHIIIYQELKAHLEVVITAPPQGTEFTRDQAFTVTATVKNSGEAVALGVSAIIDIDANAALAAGETAQKVLGELPGGWETSVSWELRCSAGGDTTIVVTAEGFDGNTEEPISAHNILPGSTSVQQASPFTWWIIPIGVVATIAIAVALARVLGGRHRSHL